MGIALELILVPVCLTAGLELRLIVAYVVVSDNKVSHFPHLLAGSMKCFLTDPVNPVNAIGHI
jgi:hypothetical protein